MISADGTLAVFSSSAPNVVAGETRSRLQVYARILPDGPIERISVNNDGVAGNGRSYAPAVSGDGRYVAFVSEASNLAAGDVNLATDVFVRDRETRMTLLVSVERTGQRPANGGSTLEALSADGRHILFRSQATDLAEGDTNRTADIYLHDLVRGTNTWVSTPNELDPFPFQVSVSGASMTPDARFIAFARGENNFTNLSDLYLVDRLSLRRIRVQLLPPEVVATSATATSFSLSPDGSAIWARVDWIRPASNALVRIHPDRAEVVRLGTFGTTPYQDSTPGPLVSPDGSRVLMSSRPDTLEPRVLPAVFLIGPGGTTLISTNRARLPGTNDLLQPQGRLVGADAALDLIAFTSLPDDPAAPEGPRRQDLYLHRWSTGETRRLANASAMGSRAAVSFSENRRVLFVSNDPTLVPGDRNQAADVFLYDWDSQQTTLVSEADAEVRSRTPGGFFGAGRPSVSRDGGTVAFISDRRIGPLSDENGAGDAFVARRGSNWLEPVSTASNGTSMASGVSGEAVISPDGQWVAFSSTAADITSDPVVPGALNLFVTDLSTGRKLLVTRSAVRPTSGLERQHRPTFSPGDGRLAFQSPVSLVPEDRNGLADIYVADPRSGEVELVSRSHVQNGSGNGLSRYPVWSPNGRWLAFGSVASDLVPTIGVSGLAWYVWDAQERLLRRLGSSTAAIAPLTSAPEVAFSGDERRLAAVFTKTGSGNLYQLDRPYAPILSFLGLQPRLDHQGGRVVGRGIPEGRSWAQMLLWIAEGASSEVISVNAQGHAADAPVEESAVTADQRLVFFTSAAGNLHPAATNRVVQLYVRDVIAGTTLLVSQDAAGRAFSAPVVRPTLSADDSTLIFLTATPGLAGGDHNDDVDLFTVRLTGTPGQIILQLSRGQGDTALLTWSTTVGTEDQLEFSDDLALGRWSPLMTPITVRNGQASAVVSAIAAEVQRFYRIRRSP